MIKFSGHGKESGRPVLGIGLTRENCQRMLDEGKSLVFATDSMPGLPPMDVLVAAGETDAELALAALEQGGEFTELTGDPIDTKGQPS